MCLWPFPVARSTPISYVYWLSKMQFASVTLRTEKTAPGKFGQEPFSLLRTDTIHLPIDRSSRPIMSQ